MFVKMSVERWHTMAVGWLLHIDCKTGTRFKFYVWNNEMAGERERNRLVSNMNRRLSYITWHDVRTNKLKSRINRTFLAFVLPPTKQICREIVTEKRDSAVMSDVALGVNWSGKFGSIEFICVFATILDGKSALVQSHALGFDAYIMYNNH